MSGVITAVSAIGTLASVVSGMKQASATKDAANQAKANADRAYEQSQQVNNRANQKSPDTMALLDAAQQAGKGGAGGTMLTGAQGIDPNALGLGKNTLLGG